MIRALATDLDGTLIPLASHAEHVADLQKLGQVIQQHSLMLLYATGRHPASIFEAMSQYQLPIPEWAICDVGTTILKRTPDGTFESEPAYERQLAELSNHFPAEDVRLLCECVQFARLQEQEKQGRFKVSFYTEVGQLSQATSAIKTLLQNALADWNVISSVDPFTNDGLIDVLPEGVSKAYAIEWWRQNHGLECRQIAYAGDSCNDLAALTAGYHGIVVANAADDLREQLKEFADSQSLFYSKSKATSGVLEGLNSIVDS